MNGYNFSREVREALGQARVEAIRLRHEYVGTEHMLLGMIANPSTIANAVLRASAVDAQAVRDGVEETVKKGRGNIDVGPDLPYTSRAKKVLELSMSYALEIGSDHVSTGHLLMGTLLEEKGIAAQVLTSLGLSVDKAGRTFATLNGSEFKETFIHPDEPIGMTGRDAAMMLRAMADSPRIRDVLRKHSIDVEALIDDLRRLDPPPGPRRRPAEPS